MNSLKEKVSNYRLIWGISLTALLDIIVFIFNSFDKLPTTKKQFLAEFSGNLSKMIVLYLTWKLNKETEKIGGYVNEWNIIRIYIWYSYFYGSNYYF